jgi:pimeloyl-ACP methyl ester carboxylesterase
MKRLILIPFAFFWLFNANAQDITGSWVGAINAGGVTLHIVFNIKKVSDTSFSATMDSPDQKAFGIPCSGAAVKGDTLVVALSSLHISYRGVLLGKDSTNGIFQQGAGKIPMGLKHITEAEKAALSVDPVRPQTPKPPFNYYMQDVEYDNADKSLHYGATFTRPNGSGKFPAVIIISGSGTQDRDGTMMKGHKPYWVLADYLTRNGIAVLRVDDRGAGKSSLGPDINGKTSLDFSYDVEASLNYLETRSDVDTKHLGLIGHSEGGMIAPMVAARRKDVSFIVLWAGPGVSGAQTLAEQYANGLVQQGVDTASAHAFERFHLNALQAVGVAANKDLLNSRVTVLFNTWYKGQSLPTLNALNINSGSLPKLLAMYDGFYKQAWIRYFIAYNPATSLSKVKCPVLAINGSKDTQVLAAENLAAIKQILTRSGNKDFEVKELPGLNHLFQTAVTGQLDEYERIQETMSPMALNIISEWVKLHTK